MFSRLAFPALLASMAILVRADPTPSEPGPGQVFNEGQSCHIAWTPDTTGQWKTMNIELMTGNNWDMIHLTTVTTLDGTSSTASYDFPCPDVTLNAPVYFYQFTSPTAVNRTWTTRFTIASASGQAVPAPNTTQPDGESIGWGVGGLSDPSTATPAPSYLTGSSSSVSTPADAFGLCDPIRFPLLRPDS
ncbi:hypothetical protein BV25DRAFT_1185409 [Artomyces pyxidatus]|uniref:Uncharacterized protein n=1 Tax=Artomyces pyxidatus TaxID=48021 RepID=A0ACB8SSV7_9AGAM|nr:hypothetical protein BV25DRAFT_1185409 [Artomyces pyxidatus]